MVLSLSITRAGIDVCFFFFLMIRRPPRSTLDRSSAASDVYKRQDLYPAQRGCGRGREAADRRTDAGHGAVEQPVLALSLIHISEPTRPY